MPFRILVPRLYLLVAWMLVAAGAPTAIATTPAELPGASAAAFAHLETGEEEQLAAADIAMVAEFDPMQAVVELRETAGATLVTRLTPQLRPGVPPHGGRIVVLRAGERRLVQLGTVFNEEDLLGNDVLVEVLEGEGRLAVRLVGKRGEREEGDTPVSVSTAEDPAGSLATARRRPRRRLEVQKLTTTDLIDRAEASGQLGHETSVLYRVYAMFRRRAAARRLPGQRLRGLRVALPLDRPGRVEHLLSRDPGDAAAVPRPAGLLGKLGRIGSHPHARWRDTHGQRSLQ